MSDELEIVEVENTKLNVRDLAKRFESINSDESSATVSRNQTIRRVKKKAATKVPPPLTVALNSRSKLIHSQQPFRRKRSSKKQRTAGLSHSITELRITTGPVQQSGEKMAIQRGPSTKMRKSKSADANIAAIEMTTQTIEPVKTRASEEKQRPIVAPKPKSMVVTSSSKIVSPAVPPKPTRLSAPSGRISQLVQRRQEELAAAKMIHGVRPSSISTTSDSPTQQRPKFKPPPSPIDNNVLHTRTGTSIKTRKRVIRKPSERPPPPPQSLKPNRTDVRLYQTLSDESEDESIGRSSFTRKTPEREAVRCRLADGTEIPRLPLIPAPVPPKQDDEIGGLYEEIEYEFTVKANESAETEASKLTNPSNQPPNRYPSHPNLAPQESNEYADAEIEVPIVPRGTQTLGRNSAHIIATALKNGTSGRSIFARSLNTDSSIMSTSMASPQFDTWNGKKQTNSKSSRPISALDLVKLDRITNGFQQLSRHVDKLKQKVGGKGQESNDRNRTYSSDRDTPVGSLDSRIYGDDWSSDEPESDEDERNVDEPINGNGDSFKYGFVHEPTVQADSLLAEIESAYRGICESSPTKDSKMSNTQQSSLKVDCSISTTIRPSASGDLESQSVCSSSCPDVDENGEVATKELVEELKAVILPEEIDSESLSDADRKSFYESSLAVQQPLYQIYMLEQQKLAEDGANSKSTETHVTSVEEHEADSVCDSASDDLTTVTIRRRQSSSASTDSGRADSVSRVTSNQSLRRERLTAGSAFGSQRSLWCEIPEVRSSGLLATLDEPSKKLQEAYFEVITSEASYLRSINVLIGHFMAAAELRGPKAQISIITLQERKHLFSNILAIRDCSERLLCDLESRLKDNLVLNDLCDILCDHFDSKFDAYIKYCANQIYQDRALKRLKGTNSQFLSCINRIEAHRDCQGLDMRSFLMLPMQRCCRYPLLVFAILDRVQAGTKQHDTASRALNLANQLVRACNEGARRMERVEQLLEIERRLVYKSPDLKRIPLVNDRRYVVKSGQLMQLVEKRMKQKLSMLQSKKLRPLFLFLFNDILMLAEKKINGTFVCKDYAQRRYVEVEPLEANSLKIPIGLVSILPPKPHLFLLVLMQNARMKHVELLVNCDSESDRERWLSAMRPPMVSNPDETIYAAWDCPQGLSCHEFQSSQEDELPLIEGDIVNILRKTNDGWYFGERVRDTRQGWFPSSYVTLLLNDHVRANNYRQRYRLMQKASEEFQLQQQRFNDKRTNSITTAPTSRSNRLRRLSNPKAFFAT
ncbi:Rho guanine nucleotide exchange factor 35 [Aphelenchoides besseyi]|nr:Rho guanine nucleotide exchange factor 35 [Aphelenchoides besseyi]